LTNVDDKGQEGIELAYNDWLQGTSGKKWVIKDRLGRTISEVQTLQAQKSGHDLVLSIDKRIQYLAYRELLSSVMENQADSGSAVVLDAKTGEILAMVNQPSFNPNNHRLISTENMRNRALTDTFEPGSTIKAFSLSIALGSGHYTPDTLIDTAPGWMRVGRNIVRDEHPNGVLSVREILDRSSNVGVTKMILSLPSDDLWELLHRVGFGEITGVGFPGEQSGSLIKHEPWGAFTLATLAWGYGLSVNTLQLARAYAIIAMHGKKLPVSLLRLDKPPNGEQVIDPLVADTMLLLLESVVANQEGTGKTARIPGYRVGGKTGTSRLATRGGYEIHNHNAVFVGIAPISNPRLVVAVVIHHPQGKDYHGGAVSGPPFEKIMEGSLRILNVPPDA
jgi:cell division protein FtsI (penicillin-binding protein 3)